MSSTLSGIDAVLDGTGRYDDLCPHDQAVVRAEWARRIKTRLRELDFAADFAAQGRTWVELDDGA